MFIRVFGNGGQAFSGIWIYYLIVGIVLVCFGILILLIPNLLQFIVASCIFIAGFSLIGLGLRLKSAQNESKRRIIDEIDLS